MDKEVKDEIKEESLKEAEAKEKEDLEEEVDYKEDSADSKDKKKKDKKEKKDAKTVEIENLKAEKVKLEAEIASWKNEYLKARAELENSKKRITDQAAIDRKYASQHVIGELIQPIDMLVQIVNMPASSDEVRNYQIGFQMISNQLVDILKGEGLKPIEAANQQFDPKYMQSLDTVSDETKADGLVVSVKQQGYMYKDRVLRPAMVVVNKIEVAKEKVVLDSNESKEEIKEEKKDE